MFLLGAHHVYLAIHKVMAWWEGGGTMARQSVPLHYALLYCLASKLHFGLGFVGLKEFGRARLALGHPTQEHATGMEGWKAGFLLVNLVFVVARTHVPFNSLLYYLNIPHNLFIPKQI